MHAIFSIKTAVCISYKNIFIKTLLTETFNQNIETCLQNQRKKLRKILEQKIGLLAEVTLFAEVLADEEHNFAAALEELALKKLAKNDVFTLIQKIFDRKRGKNHFIEVNEGENFTNAKGVVSEYTPLDTSLEKLHRKYTTLKAEWCKISDRCKNGSSLAPEKEPS